MRRNSSSLAILIVLVFGFLFGANAQPKWKLYTPPDKRFSIELPAKPDYHRRRRIGSAGSLEGPVAGITSVDSYVLPITEQNTGFTIRVYSVIAKNPYEEFEKKRASSVPAKDVLTDVAVEINGFRGRAYTYKKGKLASRHLIIFADHLVYTVTFSTESDRGIERGAVNRMFGSFRPTP